MSDIIQLLPDSIANQIAAGEVIQRPASVIKELVENAIDAGATKIKLIIKEGGRTLIQVIDNGVGMSDTDARMSFERHATSKIKSADDLFALQTLGFRGEALASIAAIAHVELKTKRKEDELGTRIVISGSTVELQEPVQCDNGSNFMVKDLFYNVPARRKFLKNDSTEFRNISIQIQRIALTFPQIHFQLIHNDSKIYDLAPGNVRQRIFNIFGKPFKEGLVNIQSATSIIKIQGYISKIEFARRNAEDFFFINNRYMRHPYFHKAVDLAYENLLPKDLRPSYFIYLQASPDTIDVNIHPTKTEIKFENESSIFQIICSTIRESLGKHNVVPPIDFDTEGKLEFPSMHKNQTFKIPSIQINPDYNPFQNNKVSSLHESDNLKNWNKIFETFETENEIIFDESEKIESVAQSKESEKSKRNIFQFKFKYVLSPVKSGLMIIDQKRAHERILFEKYLKLLSEVHHIQKTIFPMPYEFSSNDFYIFEEIYEFLIKLGFEMKMSETKKNTIVIQGIPSYFEYPDISSWFQELIYYYKEFQILPESGIREKVALSLAKASSIGYGRPLSDYEMENLIDELFSCTSPNLTADGKKILHIHNNEEFDKYFQ